MAKRRLKNGTNPRAAPVKDVSLVPPKGDMGAQGPANRARFQVIEPAVDQEVNPETGEITISNPNEIKRTRYLNVLKVYEKRGWITTRGYNAGLILQAAWARTEESGGCAWLKERVDSSPRPDVAVTMQIERLSAYHSISRRIAIDDREILHEVICCGNSIGWLKQYRGPRHDAGKAHLAAALERLADRLEGR